MRMERMGKIIFVTILLSWPLSTGWAQLRIVGTISGTVQDQTGAVIPGVPVNLRDTKTGIIRETLSTENGTFLFPDLASGLYDVTATQPGFQTSRLQNISVSTSQTTDVRITMALGPAPAALTVSPESGQILAPPAQLVPAPLPPKTTPASPPPTPVHILALPRT